METTASTVNTDILKDWITVEEAAIVAGVTVATVLGWIRDGRVRVYYFASETETVH